MKPHRLTLVNALMIGYGLDKQIHQIYNPPPASREELLGYHDKDYIDFLSRCAVFTTIRALKVFLTPGR